MFLNCWTAKMSSGTYFLLLSVLAICTKMSDSSACGGTFTTGNGTFTTPDYPDNYTNSLECEWIINPEGAIYIRLNLDYDIECSCHNCRYDSISVYTGDDTKLDKVCCAGERTFFGEYFRVVFESSERYTGPGMSANFHTAGAVYTNETGEFNSPNYPNDYPNNADEFYIVEPGTNVMMSIEYDIEAHLWCAFDSLKILDRDNSIERILCRSGTYNTYGNFFILHFTSDNTLTASGFTVSYSEEGIMTEPNGTFTSPNYPSNYDNGLSEAYVIDPEVTVELEITYDIESHPFCAYDLLRVYDRDNNILKVLCGRDVVTLTGDFFLLKFTSDNWINRRGFTASYAETSDDSQDDGNIMTESEGTFTSPNYPTNYENNFSEVYIVDPDVEVVLTITFSIEYSFTCSYDVLKVYDVNGNELESLCGTGEVVLTGDYFRLEFSTDDLIVHEGFTATYAGGSDENTDEENEEQEEQGEEEEENENENTYDEEEEEEEK